MPLLPQHLIDEHRAAAMAARAAILDAAGVREEIAALGLLLDAAVAAAKAIIEAGGQPDHATMAALGFDGETLRHVADQIDRTCRAAARRLAA